MKWLSVLRVIIIVAMFQAVALQAQVSKEHEAVCKAAKSQAAEAYCRILELEFDQGNFANGKYPPDGILRNPMTQSPIFTAAVFQEAYKRVLTSTLSADAKATATGAIQTEANQLAQTLSTKAAVPQTGANASAGGSTSLVSKPTTTDLISLAAESGAFTDTVNGTTMTAQANINGLRRYLSGEPFSTLNPTAADILQHLTVAATFNVAQSGSTAPTTGQATTSTPNSIANVLLPSSNMTFSSVGAKLAIYRPYTPTSTKFVAAWNAAMVKNEAAISTADTQLFEDFQKAIPSQHNILISPSVVAALAIWDGEASDDEKAKDFAKFVSDFLIFMKSIVTELETGSSFDQSILAVAADISQVQDVRNTVLDTARGALATFGYTYSTPAGKPATHDATAVLSYVWAKGDVGAQLTLNGAGSWFASIPPGATYGRVKDYQLSGEFDQPIGKDRNSPRAIFSVAGYGQYQYAANVLNVTIANVVPGTNISVPANSQVFTSTAGWLGVAQTKLVFNIGKGTSIPVAVKWSNKTDLLTDSSWKGQFGLSYDLSALSSILTGK